MSENMYAPMSAEPEKPKKKSKGIWSAILIPALIFGISDYVGEQAADAVGDQISENRHMSRIEEFTEKSKEYVPGTLTADSYSSEYWDLEFRAEGNWIMADEADRQALSQETLANAKASASAAIANEDISQELKDAYIDSFYGATEMYALYLDDEGYCVGEANITVTQMYGLEESNEKELLEGIADDLRETFEGVTVSEATIAGKTYNVIDFYTEQNGMVLRVRCIYMAKGISNCLIRITYLDGCEEALTSFLEQISAFH